MIHVVTNDMDIVMFVEMLYISLLCLQERYSILFTIQQAKNKPTVQSVLHV